MISLFNIAGNKLFRVICYQKETFKKTNWTNIGIAIVCINNN